MPIDPPDSEFDCIGVNGEGPYNKALVGGVIDRSEVDYVAELECARKCDRVMSFTTPPRVQIPHLGPFCPFIFHLTRLHISSCKSS
jgi:hypothetical protein